MTAAASEVLDGQRVNEVFKNRVPLGPINDGNVLALRETILIALFATSVARGLGGANVSMGDLCDPRNWLRAGTWRCCSGRGRTAALRAVMMATRPVPRRWIL